MHRLTFLVSIFAVGWVGCWNFEALTDKGPRNLDGGNGEDLYHCSTDRSATREDCTNGIDDNNDCLVDCDDPQCSDAIKCLDKSDKLIGYGTRNPTSFSCV